MSSCSLAVAVSTVILHYDVTSGGGRGEDKPKFGPNLNEFVRRFDAATTKGQGESVCILLILTRYNVQISYDVVAFV